MPTTKVSSKGWVVIPAELRKKYRLHPGARVVIVDYGSVLGILPALRKPVADSFGMLKGDKSVLKALLAERFRERPRER